MKYPNFLRDVVGYVPLTIDIRFHNNIGYIKLLLLKFIDLIFSKSERFQNVYIYDYKINIDLFNNNERILFYFPKNLINRYIKSDLYFLMKSINSTNNKIFVDIGANLGIYSLLAKRLGFTTYLFEPEPGHYAFLKRNDYIFGNVSNNALSDFSGEADFYISKAVDPGASSLVGGPVDQSDSIYERSEKVSVEKFDDFVEKSIIDKSNIRLIKIDVEGNEFNTLNGMVNYLTDFKPFIWCEVRGAKSGRAKNSYKKVRNLLNKFGYNPYRFVKNQFVYLDEDIQTMPQVFDLLFINTNERYVNLELNLMNDK